MHGQSFNSVDSVLVSTFRVRKGRKLREHADSSTSLGMTNRKERRWRQAREEHRVVLDEYVALVQSVAPDRWTEQMTGRAWSPAEETLHLIKAYDLPLGDGRMRMRVSPLLGWILRTFYLRYLLWRRTFHHGARAPSEVRPDAVAAKAMSKPELIATLQRTADDAVDALRGAAEKDPRFRLVHAYFGALDPLTGLRMLNAHTRHHTRMSKRN